MSGIVRANNAGQSGTVSNIETIDSDDYVDASIDTAHIGNDQVTGAKLNPSLVLGDIIYADGTDTIARLAKGSEDEVLTMGGSNAPTWAAASGGIASLAADTTPQVGGSAGLDLQAQLLVGNGGTTGIAISANGEVTMAAQPSVFALNSAYDNTVTGNATTATADLNSERWDQNGDFASDTFTAPITGRYLVAGMITLGERTTAHTQSDFDINYTNSLVRFAHVPNNNGNVRYGCSGTAIIDMDAADTLTLTVRSTGESSDVQRMLGHPDSNDTFMSVQLIA